MTCDYCQTPENPDYLFVHEPTEYKLCQVCLGKFLATDIEDSEDHKGYFQGYVFRKSTDPWAHKFGWFYEADMQDGDPVQYGKDIDEVLESVLMKLELI